jgi:hypothetical protein
MSYSMDTTSTLRQVWQSMQGTKVSSAQSAFSQYVQAAKLDSSSSSSTDFSKILASSLSKAASTSGTSSSSALETTDELSAIFKKASETYGISETLLKAVAKAESGFNTNAVSSAGAQGIMQLMPSTAKALGVTDSFDAEQNIMGGAKYLSQMLDRYDGDVTLALAAYNAGAGNVAKYGGVPPFTQTQNYIKKVLSYMESGDLDTSGVSIGTSTGSSGITSSTTEALADIYDISSKSELTAGEMSEISELADLIELELETSILQMQMQMELAGGISSSSTSSMTNIFQGLDGEDDYDETELLSDLLSGGVSTGL